MAFDASIEEWYKREKEMKKKNNESLMYSSEKEWYSPIIGLIFPYTGGIQFLGTGCQFKALIRG